MASSAADLDCTCPNWWFPRDKREELRKVPHMYRGVIAHHESCQKVTGILKAASVYERLIRDES